MDSDEAAAVRTNQPNVVIVLADDLGWADTGCYGATAIPTPTIDALAARGIRFTDAHAASAVCTPSRYALMTGRYPWRSPLKQGVLGGFDPPILEPDRPTLGSAFAAAGYATGYFGKWHLGLGWSRVDRHRRDAFTERPFHGDLADPGYDIDYAAGFTAGPTSKGFDTFFGVAGSLDMAPYCFLTDDHVVGDPVLHKVVDDDLGQRPGLTVEGWADDAVDTTIAEQASAWIAARAGGDRPFLAVLATMSPHRPCTPPAEFGGRSQAGRRGDAVVFVDDLLRRVVAALGPAADDTVIIFSSDNGAPMNYPEDGDTFRHRPNGPWRGQKADIWEGGHRIPLIIAGPGVTTGATCDATVSLLDLLPTLLDHATGTTPDEVDGVTFAPLLADPSAPGHHRVLGTQALNGMLALRYGSRKAVLGTGSGGFTELRGQPSLHRTDGGQLYDLADDPGELTNRWRAHPDEPWQRLAEFVAATGFDEATDVPAD